MPTVLVASGAIGDCRALMTAAGDGDGQVPGDGGALAGGGPDLKPAAERCEPVGHVPQARTHRGVAGVVAGSVVGHGEAQRSAAGLKGDAAVDAWAYLAMFCSASRQQKYTAASVSCGNRPIPSASTVTGTADLPVWALSAATSPRSASSGG